MAHYGITITRLEQIKAHVEEISGYCLKGKVCIVTGAESLKGIIHRGRMIQITCIGGEAADENFIETVCKRALVEEDRLDVFFANPTTTQLQDADVDLFMNTVRINTLSCMLAIKHASAAMMKTNPSRGKTLSGGSIILTASIAGMRSGGGPIDCDGACQLANTNVRYNICPGLTETGMTESIFEYARQRGTIGKVGQLNPLGRSGIPEEIAQEALFFASDQSSYVNGQSLAVDGGHSASLPIMPGRWM
ncbi:hypothetical protein B0H19DRAFT_1207933 [Mycena capillaripes]|nr:hypothetical protein B0H19DRAFT_1207933 [Mycena capillaripes]